MKTKNEKGIRYPFFVRKFENEKGKNGIYTDRPPFACTSLLSCPIFTPSFCIVILSLVTFLHVMFYVIVSPFVVLVITLPPFLILLVITLLLPTSLPLIALYSIRILGHSHIHPLHNIR